MLDLLIGSAYAQEAAAKPNPLVQMAPLIIIGFIMYFMMIRPQKKKMEEEKAMREGIKVGDEVYTTSGMLGVIKGKTNKVVTLEVSDGVKVKFLMSQIAGLSKTIFEKSEGDKK